MSSRSISLPPITSDIQDDTRLRKAAETCFMMPIAGLLVKAQVYTGGIRGEVYNETRGRFQDGQPIRTSGVKSAEMVKGFWVILTESSSRYVVVSLADFDAEDSFKHAIEWLRANEHPCD